MKAGKLGVLVGVVLLCSICLGDDLVGKSAPDITIREWITDNPPDKTSLSNSVYVLEFWATWCRPCVDNIAHLISLNNKYKDRGLVFISLSQDKSAKKVRRFVKQKGINYHVAIDNGTADWFGIRSYPTAVVVNHQGKVVWKGHPWKAEFERAIRRALEAGPRPLLSRIDLGPFEHLKKNLCGGSGFARAYREIESFTDSSKDPELSAIAKEIIDTIDRRIFQQIDQAEKLRSKDILAAYRIYKNIVTKYDGIEITEPAQKAYLELKKHKTLKAKLLAATGYHKAD